MKSLYEQKANKCRHFNGLMNDKCEAGVSYESVRVSGEPGKGYNLPCFKDCSVGCTCKNQSFKTHDEITAEIDAVRKHFEHTMLARSAIVEHLGGQWKHGMSGASGRIDCPACKASGLTLRFTRSGYNGHIHARCSTEGCVSWME